MKADKPYTMVKILTRDCIYFLKDCFAQPIRVMGIWNGEVKGGSKENFNNIFS